MMSSTPKFKRRLRVNVEGNGDDGLHHQQKWNLVFVDAALEREFEALYTKRHGDARVFFQVWFGGLLLVLCLWVMYDWLVSSLASAVLPWVIAAGLLVLFAWWLVSKRNNLDDDEAATASPRKLLVGSSMLFAGVFAATNFFFCCLSLWGPEPIDNFGFVFVGVAIMAQGTVFRVHFRHGLPISVATVFFHLVESCVAQPRVVALFHIARMMGMLGFGLAAAFVFESDERDNFLLCWALQEALRDKDQRHMDVVVSAAMEMSDDVAGYSIQPGAKETMPRLLGLQSLIDEQAQLHVDTAQYTLQYLTPVIETTFQSSFAKQHRDTLERVILGTMIMPILFVTSDYFLGFANVGSILTRVSILLTLFTSWFLARCKTTKPMPRAIQFLPRTFFRRYIGGSIRRLTFLSHFVLEMHLIVITFFGAAKKTFVFVSFLMPLLTQACLYKVQFRDAMFGTPVLLVFHLIVVWMRLESDEWLIVSAILVLASFLSLYSCYIFEKCQRDNFALLLALREAMRTADERHKLLVTNTAGELTNAIMQLVSTTLGRGVWRRGDGVRTRESPSTATSRGGAGGFLTNSAE